MKKIIATVLAMVMALALCTVAFADSSTTTTNAVTTTVSANDKYNVRALDSNDKLDTVVVKSYTTMVTKTVTEDGKTTKTYIPAYYTLEEDGSTVYAYECVEDVAEGRIFKDAKFVTYVIYSDTVLTDYLDAATAVKEGDGCADYEADGFKADDTVYAAAGDNTTNFVAVMVDGKLALLDEDAVIETNGHTWDKVTYATDGTPKAITCKTCKKTFDMVAQNKLGSYSGETEEYEVNNVVYLIKLGTETPSTGSDTTTSPKTFDAGIAMYVGMALTSVAGSAVVIGKKKEF